MNGHSTAIDDRKDPIPTLADEALDCELLAGHVVMRIQQLYTAGKIIDLESHNELFTAARDARNAASALRMRLEKG